jgi:diadenosine tetraphosphate (Ap4A) HIT family hydrolase
MLKAEFSCDKVNIAAIGNMVPQFHFHVIGRWKTDPYWPGVVWGRGISGNGYGEEELGRLRRVVLNAMG